MELASVAHAILDAVRPEQPDVLAAILHTRLGIRATALLVDLAGAPIGMALDRAIGLLAADALAWREPLVKAHRRDEQARRGERARHELERAEPLHAVRDGPVQREQDRHLDAA